MLRRKVTLTAAVFSASFLSLFVFSCKKDDTGNTVFEHPVMKPWFDSKCSSCHGAGGSNRSNWYYNPSDYEGSIKSNITRLNQVVYTFKSMPPGGATQTELDQFKSWFDAGYPAK